MAVLTGAIPWWGIPVNWIIGECPTILPVHILIFPSVVTFGNLSGSLFFAAVLAKCQLFIGSVCIAAIDVALV